VSSAELTTLGKNLEEAAGMPFAWEYASVPKTILCAIFLLPAVFPVRNRGNEAPYILALTLECHDA
jgi:hypothetical protein